MNDYRVPKLPVAPDNMRWSPVTRGYPVGFEVLTEFGWLGLGFPLGKLLSSILFGEVRGGLGSGVNVEGEKPAFGVDLLREGFDVTGEDSPGWQVFEGLSNVFGGEVRKESVGGFVELLSQGGFTSSGIDGVLGAEIPFDGLTGIGPGFGVGTFDYGEWETGPKFPRVASMNPVTGGIVFVKPSRYRYFSYNGRLGWVKMRGVDLLTTMFTDLWVRQRYARDWKYQFVDTMVRAGKAGTISYGLINKFNEDFYGYYNPTQRLENEVLLGTADGGNMLGVKSGLSADIEHPIIMKPKLHLKRDSVDSQYGLGDRSEWLRTDVPAFNLVVPPYHNMIIRRARVNNLPRTPWVGGPVVVGDGIDKSLLRVASLANNGDEEYQKFYTAGK